MSEMNLSCPKCGEFNTPNSILENGDICWPQMSTIFSMCHACKENFHVKVDEDSMATIRITSAPGPEWEQLQKINISGLTLRVDPEFLHCWFQGKHYEFAAKA